MLENIFDVLKNIGSILETFVTSSLEGIALLTDCITFVFSMNSFLPSFLSVCVVLVVSVAVLKLFLPGG